MRKSAAPDELDMVVTDAGVQLAGEQELHASEIKKRSLRGVSSYLLRTFFLTGLAIIAQLILPARLDPGEIGIYGIVITITSFFTIISDIGLAASLIQKKEKPTLVELRTVFTVQQMLAWIVGGLIFVSAIALYHAGRISSSGVYLSLAFGISFPIVSLKTISSILLERELQFNKLVIPAIVEAIVFNGLVISLAVLHFGVMSYTFAVLAQATSGVIVMFFIKRWSIGFAFSRQSFVNLMKVGGKFQLNDMLAKAKDDLFYISVALFIPAREFGYITWAKQWSRMPYSLTVDNVTALTFPAYSRLQNSPELLRKAIEKTLFFVTLISFPLFAGMAVMISPFIHVFPQYLKWQPAVLTLALYSFSLAFASFSTPLVNTLNAIGKINDSLKMMVFWTIAQWILFPFLFVKFGFQSVPFISAILALTSLAVVVLVKHHVKFSFLSEVWRQSVSVLCMIGILLYITRGREQTVPVFAIEVALGGITYSGLMLVLGFEKMKREIYSVVRKS